MRINMYEKFFHTSLPLNNRQKEYKSDYIEIKCDSKFCVYRYGETQIFLNAYDKMI